jgi:hypothetical protein
MLIGEWMQAGLSGKIVCNTRLPPDWMGGDYDTFHIRGCRRQWHLKQAALNGKTGLFSPYIINYVNEL